MAAEVMAAMFFATALPLALIELPAIAQIVVGAGEIAGGSLLTAFKAVPSAADLTWTFGQYIISWISCLISLFNNWPKCILFWWLDMLGQLFYLPVRTTLWMAYLIGFNLYEIETLVWDYIEKFDCFMYGIISFHLFHWPNNIRNDCYNCHRVKNSYVAEKGMKLLDDLKEHSPMFTSGVNNLSNGGHRFLHPFG